MALPKSAVRPVPSFDASQELAEHLHDQADVCCLCGDRFCEEECDDGPYIDAGWDIAYGSEDDEAECEEGLKTVSYLTCLHHNWSVPPPRHPATATLGDLLKQKAA